MNRVERMIVGALAVLLMCLMFLVCGCTMLRIPVSNSDGQYITYLRLLEKRTLSITDPSTGTVLLLSTSDGGQEAVSKIVEGAVKAIVR